MAAPDGWGDLIVLPLCMRVRTTQRWGYLYWRMYMYLYRELLG